MRLVPLDSAKDVAYWVAKYIVDSINKAQPTAEKPFVLGLPTGSTPIPVYKHLIEFYKAGKVSFKYVKTFNMDEYVGLPPEHDQSYHYFMHDNLFNHVDIQPENINLLNGMAQDYEAECASYEQRIKDAGGIDLFFGGVGIDGHIAFNEPGSSLQSRTRIKTLTTETRIANSRFFGNLDAVPKYALTVGVATLLSARQLMIMATGPSKAQAVKHAVEGELTHQWTCTALQMHPHAILACDEEACGELKLKNFKYFRMIEEIEAGKAYNFERDLTKTSV